MIRRALFVALLLAISLVLIPHAQTSCGLSSAAFCDTFSTVYSPRGRGGDLDTTKWSTARLSPTGNLDQIGTGNYVGSAIIPSCRAGVSSPVYPPDDTLVCTAPSPRSAQLLVASRIQFYGVNGYLIRQPFDFASRTGTIVYDVDAATEGGVETWVNLDILEDPVPAATFRILDNHETGPITRNALMIQFLNNCNDSAHHVTVSDAEVYNNYTMTTLTPSFTVSGASCLSTLQGHLNHFEVYVSTTSLEVWGSDYSTLDDNSFSNFHKIYAATISLPFSRGYVRIGARNHASNKFPVVGDNNEWVYHFDNVGFDGPTLTAARAYEIPDAGTFGTDGSGGTIINLGYQVSDGTNRAEGVYKPTFASPLTFDGSVNLSYATSAQMTLGLFTNTISHTGDTTWGLKYKFNGGTWRTRNFTSSEIAAVNASGSGGHSTLSINVSLADLTTGTNTIDFSTVNIPQDYAPMVTNIDLLVNFTLPTVPTIRLRTRGGL